MSKVPLQRQDNKRPKYLQFTDWVREQIGGGQLVPDQQLLSYSEIETQFGFSQNTVERAYAILEEEGLIYRKHGRGVFVKGQVSNGKNTGFKKTGFIGYIDREFQRSRNFHYYTLLMQGAQEVADDAGKQLLVISSPDNFTQWDHLEGVLLCSAGHDPSFSSESVRSLMPANLPIVNTLIPDSVVPSVLADDAGGIRQLVNYLVGLKHRRIAYLSQINSLQIPHPLVDLRYKSYLSALQRHGIKPETGWVYSLTFEQGDDYYDYGYNSMKQWLQEGWRELECTAIMAHNDLTAIGLIDALNEAGIDVPGDVSVVGFDGVEISSTSRYDLTTAGVPLRQIGGQAISSLLEYIKNPNQRAKDILLPVTVVEGSTTAALRSPSLLERV